MRIVGGIYKGRVLCPFEKIGVRPTSDMTRESLFNILQFRIAGAKFLDLFSGTGAVGIEALSRGAKEVTLNDFGRESVALIKKNIEKLAIKDGVSVTSCDALGLLKSGREKYDVIFLDPPYNSNLASEVLPYVYLSLEENGIVVLESDAPFSGEIDSLTVYDQRRYGKAHLTFFKKGEK